MKPSKPTGKKVLIFGVFDGIHEGHRALFVQARKYGDRLVIAVAQDHIVNTLKGRLPDRSLGERMNDLENEMLVDGVIPGDVALGSYEVLKMQDPDVIVLGYDQAELKKDIERHFRENAAKKPAKAKKIEIHVAKAHKPKKNHSSLIKKEFGAPR